MALPETDYLRDPAAITRQSFEVFGSSQQTSHVLIPGLISAGLLLADLMNVDVQSHLAGGGAGLRKLQRL